MNFINLLRPRFFLIQVFYLGSVKNDYQRTTVIPLDFMNKFVI